MFKVDQYVSRLGRATKLSFAKRDERILKFFREDALQVMTMDEWNAVLAKCDKYAADMSRKGRKL